ncbi:MAG: HAMP domain-containing protein [Candidatus Omnitrophica bacterium]|nr:HAMP domain-containing protein [Candidatus Omnitrophota bacterium]
MSIRVKLIIMFLIVATIPLIMASAITFNNYRYSLEKNRLSQLKDLAKYKADKIEVYFTGLKANLEIAQSLYNIRQNLPILVQFARDPNNLKFINAKKMLDEQLPKMQKVLGLSDIMLVDLEGKVVYTTNPQHYLWEFEKLLSDPDQTVFEEGKKRIYFSNIFLNKSMGKNFEIMVAGPAYDSKDVEAGLVVFEVDAKPIFQLIGEATGLGKTGETLIGKKIGDQVIFLNPLRHDSQATLQRSIKMGDKNGEPIQRAVQGQEGSGILTDYRGKEVIAAWHYIPYLQWGMVAKIDTQEAFEDVEHLKRLIVRIILVIIIVTGAMAFVMGWTISKPIKDLIKGAEIIGAGNLEHQVSLPIKNEIGDLSRSFDKMTRDLKLITASRDDLNKEVNERMHVEKELRSSNENLEQFAYVASHDLQEPLRVMGSYAGLLERRYKGKLDSDADEFISFIIDGARRMQNLINDLLAYSRVGRAEKPMVAVDCNLIFDRIFNSMKFVIDSQKAVITRDHLPVVNGLETNFIQLFQNLLGNAVKFHSREAPRVHVSATEQEHEWLFSVKDNGIGIEAQYKDRIFLIFQRLHGREEYSGTGIGLSICKKIVETRGGRIWVESENGKGSIFYFTIPKKV